MSITSTTKLIRLRDEEYPVTLRSVRQDNPNVSFPTNPKASTLLSYGYAVVEPVDQPQGEVVKEGAPVEIDGVWTQTWETRDLTEQELEERFQQKKQETISAINKSLETKLIQGVECEFDGVTEHIQLRDGDRANMAGLRLTAESMVSKDRGGEFTEIRTFENNRHLVTYEQVVELTDKVYVGYMTIMQEIWDLKDLVELAETIEDLPEVI